MDNHIKGFKIDSFESDVYDRKALFDSVCKIDGIDSSVIDTKRLLEDISSYLARNDIVGWKDEVVDDNKGISVNGAYPAHLGRINSRQYTRRRKK